MTNAKTVTRGDEAFSWPLPRAPHLPGQTPRPTDANISRIAHSAPQPTDAQAWRANESYLAGLRLYAFGYYWEAHEVWEPVWMNARPRSQERELTQGLIQLANAALKLKMSQSSAGRRLAAIAHKHFREASLGGEPVVMGVDLSAMIKASTAFVEKLTRVTDAPPPVIPLTQEMSP
jgi:uncharacterized protein